MNNSLTLQPGTWVKAFKKAYREEDKLLGYGRIERVIDVEYEQFHFLDYQIKENKIGQLMPPYLTIKLLLDNTFGFNLNFHYCSSMGVELMDVQELERLKEKIGKNKKFISRLEAMSIPEFSTMWLCSVCFLKTANDDEHFDNIKDFIKTGKTITEILKWMDGINYSRYLYFMIPYPNLATDVYKYWNLHFVSKNYETKNNQLVYTDIAEVGW
jgi:hypothetical protein